MAKQESTAQYFDVDPSEFGEDFVALVRENRALYEQQKALAKRMAAMLAERINPAALPEGYEIKSVVWTRWGQMQAVADAVKAKGEPKVRQSLSAWQGERDSGGERR